MCNKTKKKIDIHFSGNFVNTISELQDLVDIKNNLETDIAEREENDRKQKRIVENFKNDVLAEKQDNAQLRREFKIVPSTRNCTVKPFMD